MDALERRALHLGVRHGRPDAHAVVLAQDRARRRRRLHEGLTTAGPPPAELLERHPGDPGTQRRRGRWIRRACRSQSVVRIAYRHWRRRHGLTFLPIPAVGPCPARCGPTCAQRPAGSGARRLGTGHRHLERLEGLGRKRSRLIECESCLRVHLAAVPCSAAARPPASHVACSRPYQSQVRETCARVRVGL